MSEVKESCETECIASQVILAWYTEARILIGVDPLPESESGKRLNFLISVIQEYEKVAGYMQDDE